MVEITNFDWGGESVLPLIFCVLFVTAFVSLMIPPLLAYTYEMEKLSKTVGGALMLLSCGIAIASCVSMVIVVIESDNHDERSIGNLTEEFYDSYEVSLREETADGVEEFHASDWVDELRDFLDGDTEHRTYVLAREEGRPDTEAVLLFERDDTDSDDFTVSLVIPQKGDKDVEFLDYNTGEPINEGKTTNTDEEETD